VLTTDDNDVSTLTADRQAEMKRNVERLLEARVGPGNAVVEISVATVTEREQIVERRFDPESRVAISTETEERSSSSNDTADGVTVASNLPDGDAGQGGSTSSQDTETRERTNFEVNETQREILRTPGAVKRVSVAVLVDGIRVPGADGQLTWQPRSEDEIEALRELVSSAVGYDTERGDTITIKSMEFQAQATDGTLVTSSLGERMSLDVMSLIQLAVLAVVVLALGLFVVRPILANRREDAAAARIVADEGEVDAADALPSLEELAALPPLDGSSEGFGAPMKMAEIDYDGSGQGGDPGDAVARLRRLIEERQEETVGVLRSWMEDKGEKV
jgi:flagellar M-ring protein FliF